MATLVLNSSKPSFSYELYGIDHLWHTFGLDLTATRYYAASGGMVLFMDGADFSYVGQSRPQTGVIGRIHMIDHSGWDAEITGLSYSAARLEQLVITGADLQIKAELFAGDDRFQGSSSSDFLRSFAGSDTVNGGLGNDVLIDASGSNYLRGDEGNDSITGGSGFDDINGNMGNDHVSGGDGDDWVLGGKDNDVLSGGSGADLAYGNLGSDTCDGGSGDDIVRGGQQDDVLSGGDGNDYLSGDRDNDTISGGSGADRFHTFGEAGLDRVLDFNLAEGDRVMLDPGTQYSLAQVGADTVISMTGGGQMVLVGVQLSTLTPGWIYESW